MWNWQKPKPPRCPRCKKVIHGQDGGVLRKHPTTGTLVWWHFECAGVVSTLKRGAAYVRAIRWRDHGKRAMKKTGFDATIRKLGRG